MEELRVEEWRGLIGVENVGPRVLSACLSFEHSLSTFASMLAQLRHSATMCPPSTGDHSTSLRACSHLRLND